MVKKFPKLKGKAILAPMAGVTDVAWRALCKNFGAALTYTEFVHSTGLARGSVKAKELIQVDPSEKPCAVQLFGSNEKDVLDAARLVEKRFDIIDINCGCPAHKVVTSGAGSEMLRNPKKIGKLVSKLVDAVNKPITIKIRTGINDKKINAVEVARIAEEAGAAAITVHGRTQEQGYRGKADWEIIRKVKESVGIPVIGNGDVDSPEIFKKRISESGVDAIMIGRAALGTPWIFEEISSHLKGREIKQHTIKKVFSQYITLAKKYSIPFSRIKLHAMHLTKGLPGSAKLRHSMLNFSDLTELERLFSKIHY